MVDLKNIYKIISVCLLNRGDHQFYTLLKNFDILLKQYPFDDDENDKLCGSWGSTPVKKSVNFLSDYECLNCSSNAIGSFLQIRAQFLNTFVGMCDVKVYGELVEKRDFQIISLSHSENFDKTFSLTKLRDEKYETIFSMERENDVFFRLDFMENIRVYGVIITCRRGMTQ
ncbi:DgyrCDS11256 [Dimorphilus gyrociliatus]|uniref:DgyrCDS11256 n=1 Tax=Dimorphilus gyrociliatus TaxID=2664684 RepID=A0A7I8W7L6_9ANNE|nr:DgyrCDS11256 [Dimorphilus gyrociliatus]